MLTRDIGLKNVGLIDLALSSGFLDALECTDHETRGSLWSLPALSDVTAAGDSKSFTREPKAYIFGKRWAGMRDLEVHEPVTTRRVG